MTNQQDTNRAFIDHLTRTTPTMQELLDTIEARDAEIAALKMHIAQISDAAIRDNGTLQKHLTDIESVCRAVIAFPELFTPDEVAIHIKRKISEAIG